MAHPQRLSVLDSLWQRRSRNSSSQRQQRRTRLRKLVGIEPLEPRRVMATITWGNVNGGNWSVASNWVGGVVPGASDDAVIPDLPGTPTLTFNTGTASVKSLTVSEPFIVSGGTFSATSISQLAGSFSMLGGTVASATIAAGTATVSVGVTLGTFNVATGATLNVLPNATIQVANAGELAVSGTANFGNGSTLTLVQTSSVGNASDLVINNQGVVNLTGASVRSSGFYSNRTLVDVRNGGRFKATDSTITVVTQFGSNAVVSPGDLARNRFDADLYLPYTVINMLSAAGGGADNLRFSDIYIASGTLASGSLDLRAIGTETTTSLDYFFNGNFTIPAGTTLNVSPAVRTWTVNNTVLSITGTANLGSGSTLSLYQDSSVGVNSQLVVNDQGTLNLTGATINRSGYWSERTFIDIKNGGRFKASDSTISVLTTLFGNNVAIAPGDLARNRFDGNLFLPYNLINMLSAAGGGADNLRFADIYIASGTLASGSLDLRAIGTETTTNLDYVFNGNFTIPAGTTLNVSPTVRTWTVNNTVLSITGTANLGSGSTLSLYQDSSVGVNSQLVVNDQGTLNLTGATINRSGYWSERTFIDIKNGGRFKASDSTISVLTTLFGNNVVIAPGDLARNRFDGNLFLPYTLINMLSAAGGGADNLRFADIYIASGTLASGSLDLRAIGTETTTNLDYVFNGNFTIPAGTTLNVSPTVRTWTVNNTVLNITGTANLGSGSTLSLFQDSSVGVNSQLVVNNQGTLNLTGATINRSGYWSERTFIDIKNGGRFKASDSTISVLTTQFGNNVVIAPGDLARNRFDGNLFLPYNLINMLSAAGGGADNLRFADIYIASGTLASGSLDLRAIGTETTTNLDYVFNGNFTIPAGTTLNVSPTVRTWTVNNTVLSITGTANLGSGSTLSLYQDSSVGVNSQLVVNDQGTLNLTGATINRSGYWSERTFIDIKNGGRFKASDSTISVLTTQFGNNVVIAPGDLARNRFDGNLFLPYTLINMLSAAGGGADNLRFADIYIASGTLASGSLDLRAIGTETTTNLDYVFNGNFTIAAGTTLNVSPTVRTWTVNSTVLSITGTANLGSGSTLSLYQDSSVGVNSQLVVNDQGTLNLTGATINRSGYWSERTSIDIKNGSRFKASDSTIAVTTFFGSNVVIAPGDLARNRFDANIFLPYNLINMLSAAGGGADNLRFADIYIASGTLAAGSLDLRAMGTETTTNLDYIFNGNFTIPAGTTLNVSPTVRTWTINATVLSVSGAANFGTGSSLTLVQDTGSGTPSQLVVNSTGVISLTGAALKRSSYWSDRTLLDVKNGGSLNSRDTSIDVGTFAFAAGANVNFAQVSSTQSFKTSNNATVLNNTRSIDLTFGSTFNVTQPIQIGSALADTPTFNISYSSTLAVTGSVTGRTRSPSTFNAPGRLLLNGVATTVLEVMGADVGAVSAGFVNNFAYGKLELVANASVRLTNADTNWSDGRAEALYVNTLIVNAGARLDLNGQKLYVRAYQNLGTIVNGAVSVLPVVVADGGPLAFGVPTPGTIAVGTTDTWTFTAPRNAAVAIQVNPSNAGITAAVPSVIGRVLVELLNASDVVIKSGESAVVGGIVNLVSDPLVAGQGYKIRVKAPTAFSTLAGNYVITLIDPANSETGVMIAPDADSFAKLEGNSGLVEFKYTISRFGDLSNSGSVNWSVSGSGSSPANAADFVGNAFPSGIVTFAVGETTKSITVQVAGDTNFENDEAFQVSLTNPTNAMFITTGSVVSTILNDDQLLYSDLIVESVVYSASVETGGTQTIAWREKNAGAVDVNGNWRTLVRVTNRATGQVVYNDAPLYVGNRLTPQAFVDRFVQFTLPNGNSGVGIYDILIRVDSSSQITESNLLGTAESNNDASGSFNVTLAPNPDLLVESITAPAAVQLSVPFDVTWTVRNAGNATLTRSTQDRVYLSLDGFVDSSDRILATVTTAGIPLTAGEAASQTVNLTLPLDIALTSGAYRLLVVTDVQNDQLELNETNNLLSRPLTIELPPLPDLIVEDIATRNLAVAGQTVQVTWTVKNQGTAPASGTWNDRVFLSSDGIIGGDLFLKDFPLTINLLPGQSIQRTQEVQIPAGLSGAYRFVIGTDVDNRIQELNREDNNLAIDDAVITIDARPSANLIVGSITSLTNNLFSGQSATVEWTVKNNGNASTNSSGWEDQLFLSKDATLSSDDVFLGRAQNPSFLNIGEAYRSSLTVNLPQDAVGQRYFIVLTDARNQLVETGGEDDNTRASDVTSITLTPPPDLFVTSVASPRDAFEGEPIVVGWTVKNQGTGPTRVSQWTDRVYLSLNGSDLDNADILLQSVTHSGILDVDAEYRVSGLNIVLPENVLSESAYILVRTDATNVVYEHDFEGNNVTSAESTTRIRLRPQPDLVIDSLIVPASATAGQPLPVTYTVTNASVQATRQTVWQDTIYLSSDATLDPQSDLLLGRRTHVGVLDAVQSETVPTRFSLPNTLSGNYFVFVVTDSAQQVVESSDSNNVRVSESPISIVINPPDLRVQSVTSSTTPLAGRLMTVNYTVANIGGSPTPNDQWSDAFYLSTDDQLDASDRLLVHRSRTGQLAAGASETRSISFRLPADYVGPAHLLLHTDSFNQVYELNNDNNILATSMTIGDDRPDLVVTAFNPRLGLRTFLPGTTLAFDYTVTNRGLGATFGSSWFDRVVLSSDLIAGNSDDILLTSLGNLSDLAAGQAYTRLSENIRLPASLPDGQYRLMLITDATGSVGETDNTNNVAISPDFVVSRTLNADQAPDLVVTSLTAPATVDSGDKLNLSWTIRNQGSSATTVSSWRDDVWLSQDSVIDSSDILVGRYYRAGTLAAGATYTRSANWPIDINLFGNYFVIVESDVDNQVHEGLNEDNNKRVSATATTINLGPTPDLQVTNVALPLQAYSDRPATFGWTVSNTGGRAATSSWVDSVYLSLDQIFDRASDIPLGYVNRTVDLPAGSLYSASNSLSIPAGIGGSYYVFVVTDATNRLFERNGESNNVTLANQQLNIAHLPPADLVVGSITVPVNSQLGQTSVLSFTVNNQGQNPAVGQWYDAVFLSSDDQWDLDDAYVGRVLHTGDIASGGSYTSTLTAPLPGVLPGSYKVIVRSDIRNNIVESDEANNITASLNGFGIDVATLVLGTPQAGTITKNGAVYYKVDVPAGETVVIEFDSAKTVGMTELYASFNSMPRRSKAELVALEPFQTDQRIVISATQAGTYYIMAYGNDVESGSSAFTITARIVPFTVFDTSFGQGGTAGNRTILISGAKFDRSVTAELVDGAGNAWSAVRYTRVSDTRVYATFDLSDRVRGSYSVRLTKGSTSQVVNISNSLQVVFATISSQPISLTRPDTFNRRRDDRPPAIIPVTVAWRNTTLNDIAVPWIHFSATDPFAATMEDAKQGKLVSSTEFLGYARSDGPRDILLPGDFASAEFYVQPASTVAGSPPKDIYYVAEYFYEAAAARYPWDFDFSQLDLSQLSDDEAIEAIAAFKQFVGSNVGGLRQAMTEGLQRLGTAAPADIYQASRVVLQDVFDRFLATRLTSLTGVLTFNSLSVNYLDLTATLKEMGGGTRSYSTRVLSDGSFVFAKLPAATYELQITGAAVRLSTVESITVSEGQHAKVSRSLVAGPSTPAEPVAPRLPTGTALPAAPFVTRPGNLNEAISGNVLESILPQLQGIDYRLEIVGDVPQGFLLSSNGEYHYSSSQITAFVVHYDLVLPDTATRVGRLFQNEIRSRGALAITLKNNFTRDVRALDPNDILGPAGYGDEKWVSSSERLNYTIRYENDPKNASSAAQLVNVVQILDSDLDPRSVEFGSFGFGGRVFTVPPRRQSLTYDIDLREEMGIFVRVFAFVDQATGEVNWSFTSISPETNRETTRPEDGFLPLNFVRPEGDGFVSYSVKVKSGVASGSRLDAQARIIFDGNLPIDTPAIFNTLDATRPVSAIAQTQTIPGDGRMIVTWDGNDGEIGSGLSTFDIYVSENDGRYRPWLQQVDGLSAEYAALPGRKYDFVTIARDNVGNAEQENKLPDSARPEAKAGGPYAAVEGTTLTLQGLGMDPNGSTSLFYEWDLDYDGQTFDVDSTQRNPTVPIGDGPSSRTVALRVRVGSAQALASLVSTSTITVTNSSPVLSRVNNAVNGFVYATLTNSGTWQDAVGESVFLTASLGSVVKNDNGSWTWSLVSTQPRTGETVTITARDKDDGLSSISFTISASFNPATFTPSLTSSVTSITSGRTVSTVLDFGAAVSDFAIDDLITTNVSDVVITSQGNGRYTLAVTAQATGVVSLAVRPGAVFDNQGRSNAAISALEWRYVDTSEMDFGDAPANTQSGFTASYPTLLSQNGAAHRVSSLRLGTAVDADQEGTPSTNADGDDLTSLRDEDGIEFVMSMLGGRGHATGSTYIAHASAAGKLDAWIDFNRDGDWDDAGEQIATSLALAAGANTVSFVIPANSQAGMTYARFRISSTGGLAPTGQADDGEVEDYQVTIRDESVSTSLQLPMSVVGAHQVAIIDGRLVVSRGNQIFFQAAASSISQLRLLGATNNSIYFVLSPNTNLFGTVHFAGEGLPIRITSSASGLRMADYVGAVLGVDTIELTADGAQSLVLSAASIELLNAQKRLRIKSGIGDTVSIVDKLSYVTRFVENGELVHRFSNRTVTLELDNARDWYNSINPLDVNGDGLVTPIDALLIINQINVNNGNTRLPEFDPARPDAFSFMDVTGNGTLEPLDVLFVINRLNNPGSAEGEASALLPDSDTTAATDAAFDQADLWLLDFERRRKN